jgi:hypothetical protein
MSAFTESIVEHEALAWFEALRCALVAVRSALGPWGRPRLVDFTKAFI